MSSTMSKLIGAIPTNSSSKPIDQSRFFNPVTKTPFLKIKESAWNLHGRSCRSLQRNTFLMQSNVNPPPEVPLPSGSGSPSGSLRNWIVGLVLTFVIPFYTHKWGSFFLLKNQVDQKIQSTEHLLKGIENIAERADKVIDRITDDLPEGSKLKKSLEHADQIIERIAKSAHVADDFILKVEKAEDKLESLIHRENNKGEEIPHESKDKEDDEISPKEQNDM